MNLSPRAPQGPSDEELNRITPDPLLPRFGGSRELIADIVCGPYMSPGTAQTVLAVRDRTMGSFPLSKGGY